ncbi:hypothetical protein CHL79_05380 [Delftia acidovorans]|nr:hypothetical protein CHL79_05380 [Delftia acidovorans]
MARFWPPDTSLVAIVAEALTRVAPIEVAVAAEISTSATPLLSVRAVLDSGLNFNKLPPSSENVTISLATAAPLASSKVARALAVLSEAVIEMTPCELEDAPVIT